MGYNEKTVGGGPATGLATDFTGFLQNLLRTGSFSPAAPSPKGGVGEGSATSQFNTTNPMSGSTGIFNLMNSLISNPTADQSVQTLINKDIERGRNDLRARFGSQGGMAFGTPAAMAESVYQAEQAPRTAMAMDEMAHKRMSSLMPFFQAISNLSSLGIPQAQTAMQPSGFMQGFNLIMDLANTAANFLPTPKGSTNRTTPTTYGPSRRYEEPPAYG